MEARAAVRLALTLVEALLFVEGALTLSAHKMLWMPRAIKCRDAALQNGLAPFRAFRRKSRLVAAFTVRCSFALVEIYRAQFT